MQTQSSANDAAIYKNIERSLGSTKPADGPFQPLDYLKENLNQSTAATKASESEFMMNRGFPDLTIGDSENDSDLAGGAKIGGDSDGFSFVSLEGDRAAIRIEQRLDGPAVVREPAEPGNAHQIVDVIAGNNFQNPDLSLTPEATEAIRAAVANTGWFQTYEGRAQEVQDYVNQFIRPGISVTFDRDRGNANTAVGSRPAVILDIPGNRPTRIPMR